MRTTIDLPDELFHQLKVVAASRRVTMKTLVQRAVEKEVTRQRPQGFRRRPCYPLLDSKKPRTLNLTNAEIANLLT